MKKAEGKEPRLQNKTVYVFPTISGEDFSLFLISVVCGGNTHVCYLATDLGLRE